MEMDLIERFINDCELRGLAPISIQSYRKDIRWFAEYMSSQNKDLTKVDRQDIKNYIGYLRTEKKLKRKSIEHILGVVSAFYAYLVEEEDLLPYSPMTSVMKKYLHSYKDEVFVRRCITIEEASRLVNSILEPRDRAMIVLLLKTGIRIHELVELDVGDVDLKNRVIKLKPTPKRSNRIVFFDDEAQRVLERWLRSRQLRYPKSNALFPGRFGGHIIPDNVRKVVIQHAERVGLRAAQDGAVTPHGFRHWFTTYLIRSGMPREYVKELRGDSRGEAIDIYIHIDREELRKSYLAHIPRLGV